MKSWLMMKKIKEYNLYEYEGSGDIRFIPLARVFSDDFQSGELINWLMDSKRNVTGSALVDIQKQGSMIVLHDMSDSAYDYTISSYDLNPAKRFDMTLKNFSEIVFAWEALRISKPDTILVVIHEDNHVSLETDPEIIKAYQDAGYAFDCNKK